MEAELKQIAAVAAPAVAPPAPAATPAASVRSHYTRKQRVARCSKITVMLSIGVAGCLLEVRFAGLRTLDAGKCAVFCSCAKFAQLCTVCTDEISSLAV